MTEEDYILVSNLRAIVDALAVLDHLPPCPEVKEGVTEARKLLDTAQVVLFAKLQSDREKIKPVDKPVDKLCETCYWLELDIEPGGHCGNSLVTDGTGKDNTAYAMGSDADHSPELGVGPLFGCVHHKLRCPLSDYEQAEGRLHRTRENI